MIAAARRFALGSYTPGGPGPGLHLAERSEEGDWRLVASAVTSNPSFVARTGDLLFAVGEDESGSVSSFRMAGDALERVATVEHGEAEPCHVVVDAASGVLLVANYGAGSVTAVPFEAATGTLGRPVTLTLPHRTGPVADRQEGPHAHQVVPTPWGTHLVSDLGGDAIHEFVIERSGGSTLREPQGGADAAGLALRITRTIDLAPGTGPRHMLVRSGLVHVVGELDGLLHTFEVDAATAVPAGTEPTVVRTPASDDDVVQPSHLDASPSGRLYTALVRGRDSVSVFDAIDPAHPHLASEHQIGAALPRHHAHLDDRTVVVAAQEGGALVEVDLVTGAARRVLELTSPTCVLPLD